MIKAFQVTEFHARVFGRTCKVCGRAQPYERLNYEALVHHKARRLECKDRKDCERHRRRSERGHP